MRRFRLARLSVILAAAPLAAACGPKGESETAVVAEVGGRPIEMREITEYLATLHMDYPDAETEIQVRRRHLNRLIEEQLFVIGGYTQALDADIGILELVDRERDKFLLDELFRAEVIDKATVPEADVRVAYAHWFDRVYPLHIMVESKALADSILERLNAGENFGDLAEQFSKDPATSYRGGDFGREFRWGELLVPLQELAFSLKEGETGGPVQTQFGWHILRIKSRSKVESRPYEDLAPQIEGVLARQYQERRRLDQLDELRGRASIVLSNEAVKALRQAAPGLADTVPATLSAYFEIPIDDLPIETREMSFATLGSGLTITVEQIVKSFNSRAPEGRPDLLDEQDLRETVFQVALYDLLREEALRLKLDQTPLYKERLREFQEKLIAEKMRSALVSRNVRVTNEDVQSYYEANRDSFITPVSYRVREVLLNDEETARRILTEARKGTPLSRLAEQHTMRPGFRKSGGDLGWIHPSRYPDLYKYAATMQPGEIGGPVPGVSQYSVIQVVEVRPSAEQPFSDAQNAIFDRLQKMRTDSVIQAYKDSMSVLYPVVIHEEVLRKDLRAPRSGSGETEAG